MITPIECVGIICLRGDETLLIKRGKPPREGEWSLPGGRIEPGETARDAAARELLEETGVLATIGELIEIIDAEFDGQAYRLHDFIAVWVGGDPIAGDDAKDARFVSINAIRTLGMWSKTEDIIETCYARSLEQYDL